MTTRRRFLAGAALLSLSPRFGFAATATDNDAITRAIPSSGERIPVIGMGSWLTFDVAYDPGEREDRVEVLRTFFRHGGTVIDSSPMYGSSEETIGYCLERLDNTDRLFSATKVWTLGQRRGIRQMQRSQGLWDVDRFDLMQVHNLLELEKHLETLKAWKAEGKVRYIGVTTSHGRRHDKLAQIMESEPLDFVQFTYNVTDREAEQRLLPLAQDRGIAVLINRPFQRGALFDRVQDQPLPDWAGEIDCQNWAQFFLKFIVSHPAVTCAIPATSRVDHMQENMGAGYGRLPDQAMRREMVGYFSKVG